jgi:hypothetical protein
VFVLFTLCKTTISPYWFLWFSLYFFLFFLFLFSLLFLVSLVLLYKLPNIKLHTDQGQK